MAPSVLPSTLAGIATRDASFPILMAREEDLASSIGEFTINNPLNDPVAVRTVVICVVLLVVIFVAVGLVLCCFHRKPGTRGCCCCKRTKAEETVDDTVRLRSRDRLPDITTTDRSSTQTFDSIFGKRPKEPVSGV
ncbi:hypothetical protein K402DRAFT_40656 [Aulographum hederae CBS 113979]|uniref:Uncharacterized protein n=1 Tax=Aulographum hederae CBS 113979 TaxID=1176131 RepID=A0A6G1H4V9_9PEZI|nr:hypothetical protein K402DRAFT_40656 [Aulographum hederae CBS 113979]